MRLVVLGGSGRTGVHLVERALGRGHKVTALVRCPAKLPARDGLHVCEGTPLNLNDVYKAFEPFRHCTLPKAIVICLNPSRATDSPFSRPTAPPRFMADSVANTITAMKTHDISSTSKLVVMQALGVGSSFPNLPWWMRVVRHWTYMKHSYDDHDLVDREVRLAGVKYVLPRPPLLTNGGAGPVRCFGEEGRGIRTLAMISRKSVVEFMLDACERGDWDCSTPVITS